MAIEYVGGVEGGRAGATSTTTQSLSGTLTGGIASSPSAGDFVVVWCAAASEGTGAVPTQTVSGNNSGTYDADTAQNITTVTYDTGARLNYKRQGSSVDTSLTIPSSGNNRNAQRWAVHVFRGVDAATPLDVTTVQSSGTATGRPDPGAISPSSSGAWILWCGASAAATGTAYTAPTDFSTDWLGNTQADTADVMTGFGYYTGWTSGSYNPAAISAGGTTGANDSWVASAAALRPDLTQTLTPGLFTSGTNAFYAPTVTPGAVTLTPALYSNTNSFYSPTLSYDQTLTPSLFTNSNSFYNATVSAGEVTLTPSLYENANDFYSATVSIGATTLYPDLVTNTNDFYSATVTVGAVTLTPGLYENANGFYAPAVTVGGVTLTPSLYSNTNDFYSATVTASYELTPGLYTNSNGFYSATVTAGEVTLTPSLFSNNNSFYAPTVSAGDGTLVQSARFDNSNDFYAHTVAAGEVTLSSSLFSNTNNFYSPTITVGDVASQPAQGAARGGKSGKKKLLEVNGKLIPFNSESEIIAYLDRIKASKVNQALKTASSVAMKAVTGQSVAPPILTIAPVDFRASQAILDRIAEINRSIELAYYLRLKQEAIDLDEEEALIAILMMG